MALTGGKVATGSPLVLTITTVNGPTGSDERADEAFVRFVLSPQGRAIYQHNGYTLLPVTITGSRSAVPKSIRSEISK